MHSVPIQVCNTSKDSPIPIASGQRSSRVSKGRSDSGTNSTRRNDFDGQLIDDAKLHPILYDANNDVSYAPAKDLGFDVRLIEEIKSYLVLYGAGHCPHGSSPKRVECWDMLAKALGLPGNWSGDAV